MHEQERIQEMLREAEELQEKECTFAPIIDKRSDRLMTQRAVVLKVRADTLWRTTLTIFLCSCLTPCESKFGWNAPVLE